MERLVHAVQELSLARDLESVMSAVRRAARELTGADGATFILRDGDCCYYAEENAIAPLWKGMRFPLTRCISGWAMLNRESAVIEDIYNDARIPVDAYRPTFVKSLAMVPIRKEQPIGAIGNYWAHHRRPTGQEVSLLEALANTTSVALENVQVYAELEKRVAERTAALEAANAELDSFAFRVAHDLAAPARHVSSYAEILQETLGSQIDGEAREFLQRIGSAAENMSSLITSLLAFARLRDRPLESVPVDLGKLVVEVRRELESETAGRTIEWRTDPLPTVLGDEALLRIVLTNLLSNAVKYTRTRNLASIEITAQTEGNRATISIRDNGVGFDNSRVSTLFTVFQRLHSASEFEGNGVGLANVRRIVERHGGSVSAQAERDKGATFSISLPLAPKLQATL